MTGLAGPIRFIWSLAATKYPPDDYHRLPVLDDENSDCMSILLPSRIRLARVLTGRCLINKGSKLRAPSSAVLRLRASAIVNL